MSEATTESKPRGRRKVREGVVTSDKMDKTIVVQVEDRVKHALYGKVMTKSSKLHVLCGLPIHQGGQPAAFSLLSANGW